MVQAGWKALKACCLLAAVWCLLGATTLWESWLIVTDNQQLTLAWDPVEGATRYELKVMAKYPDQEWIVSTINTQAVFGRPRSGLYRFGVRTCNADGCGDWAYSDGSTASVTRADGSVVTQPWVVFWRLSPVVIHP